MMNNITEQLKARTKSFAKGCVKLLSSSEQKGRLFWHIENQLIRCSTSVAANYRAACLAQSKASFVAKLSIVLEEVDESAFWLELLLEENLVEIEQAKKLYDEASELTKIFVASRKTLNNRTNQ